MDSPSWMDAIRASVSSCVPCFGPGDDSSSSSYDYAQGQGRSNRPPQSLESLLADASGSSTDNDGETLSLHSNIGDAAARRKRRRRGKGKGKSRGITLWGFDLFGRRGGGVQLDDEDDLLSRNVVRPPRNRTTSTASSSSTDDRANSVNVGGSYLFSAADADASPLDTAAISSFTPSELESRTRAAQEAEAERLAKEERKRKRREKKELKRLAARLAASDGMEDEGEFEGFQGSGGGSGSYRAIPSPLLRPRSGDGSVVGSGNGSFSNGSNSERGSVPTLRGQTGLQALNDADDEDGADLDAAIYARSSRSGKYGSASGGGSDSRRSGSTGTPSADSRLRSNLSGGGSDGGYRGGPPLSPGATPHYAYTRDGSSNPLEAPPPKKKSSSKKSKSSKISETSSSTTNTSNTSGPTISEPSLPSPTSASPHSPSPWSAAPPPGSPLSVEGLKKAQAKSVLGGGNEFPSGRIGGGGGFGFGNGNGSGGGGGVNAFNGAVGGFGTGNGNGHFERSDSNSSAIRESGARLFGTLAASRMGDDDADDFEGY
jgi:hypothetical protein